MKPLATRQIHLDFHTSELMPGIGKNFSKQNFQKALKIGNVNSITLFGKCHHSWCYFPSKVGNIHPNLDFDLLGKQIEAAKEIGVKTPIYITVGWSAADAEAHPDWVSRDKDGNLSTVNYDLNAKDDDKKPNVSWKFLCPNGEYGQHIYDLTREICERYKPVDGIFYDICYGMSRGECHCPACREDMKKKGIDESDPLAVTKHIQEVWEIFSQNCFDIIKSYNSESTVYFNGGANLNTPQWHKYQTHFEMEDLPTTWGGYDKMPPRAKYFANTGKDYLGMTGKFHTNWGEFGGFKSPLALKAEIAAMMMYGAKCSVGDQVHPSGEMDLETYRIVGEAYKYAETLEEYCFNVKETAKLGIIVTPVEGTEFDGDRASSNEGLIKSLLETGIDFDVILSLDDLKKFDTVVLQDGILLNDEGAKKIKDFVNSGGGLVLTGSSGLDVNKKKFMIDIDCQYMGHSDYDMDYVFPGWDLVTNIINSKFLFYTSAAIIKPGSGAKVLADVYEPYFNRRYKTYCSHQNTPYKTEKAAYPAAVQKGRVVYLAHNIASMYHKFGCLYHRDYLVNAIKLVYKGQSFTIENKLSGARARLVKQENENRYVFHYTYAPPVQRGITSVIEDIVPVYNTKVSLKISEKIKGAYLAPNKKSIDFVQSGEDVKICIEELVGHQMVVFDV